MPPGINIGDSASSTSVIYIVVSYTVTLLLVTYYNSKMTPVIVCCWN